MVHELLSLCQHWQWQMLDKVPRLIITVFVGSWWWWDVNPLNALQVLLPVKKHQALSIPGNYLGKPLQQYAGGKPQNDAFPIVLLAWVLLAAELQKFRITMIMAPEAICFVNVAPKNTDDEDDDDVTIWSCFSNQVMYLCINKKCALKTEIIVHLKRNDRTISWKNWFQPLK